MEEGRKTRVVRGIDVWRENEKKSQADRLRQAPRDRILDLSSCTSSSFVASFSPFPPFLLLSPHLLQYLMIDFLSAVLTLYDDQRWNYVEKKEKKMNEKKK